MDILCPIVHSYPGLHVNHVEEAPHLSFLEFVMEYENHIKQWLLKVE